MTLFGCCLSGATWALSISAHVLCTPYNHAAVLLCHFIRSHIGRVHVCLAVTWHLSFWQNDLDLLHATAVTWGWDGHRNKSQHRKLTLDKKISRLSCRELNPWPFDDESRALTTELYPLPFVSWQSYGSCSCINSTMTSWGDNSTGSRLPEARPGFCTSACNMLYPFALVNFFGAFAATVVMMPCFIVSVR